MVRQPQAWNGNLGLGGYLVTVKEVPCNLDAAKPVSTACCALFVQLHSVLLCQHQAQVTLSRQEKLLPIGRQSAVEQGRAWRDLIVLIGSSDSRCSEAYRQ